MHPLFVLFLFTFSGTNPEHPPVFLSQSCYLVAFTLYLSFWVCLTRVCACARVCVRVCAWVRSCEPPPFCNNYHKAVRFVTCGLLWGPNNHLVGHGHRAEAVLCGKPAKHTTVTTLFDIALGRGRGSLASVSQTKVGTWLGHRVVHNDRPLGGCDCP